MLAFASCKHDPDPGSGPGAGPWITPPSVGALPAFPAGSTPAATRADAEAVLKELRQTRLIEDISQEIWEVFDENRLYRENYSFSNKSLPNGNVSVSASGTYNETNTGGFKALDDLYYSYRADELTSDEYEEERNKIQFAHNDKKYSTGTSYSKGEVTRAKTEGGVTIAQGSTFDEPSIYGDNFTVTTAGDYTTFKVSGTAMERWQSVYAFTVTTSRGSVKVILDAPGDDTGSVNNALYSLLYSGDFNEWIFPEFIPGSLKVYGKNNALLIDHKIVDWESLGFAWYMIEHDPYPFDSAATAGATPLTANTVTNGTIASNTPDWYSINVANGQKYHLWWDDADTSDRYSSDGSEQRAYVKVRGYDSNGNAFFDTDGDWTLDWRNYHSFTATSTGTVYIMVYPEWSGSSGGTYAIAYNTTGNQPASMRSASSIVPVSPFGAARAEPAAGPNRLRESARHGRR